MGMIHSKKEQLLSYDVILLAVDGSEKALKATRHAIHLAKRMQATVKIVFVDDDGEDAIVPYNQWPVHSEEKRIQWGLAGIHEAINLAKVLAVPVEGMFLRGSLTKTLIAAAAREHASLIVVGDMGFSGIERFLLGSFAESIMKASTIPVLIVK